MVNAIKWIGHYVQNREIYLEFDIVNKEPLRIGSGREVRLTSPVDLPVLKLKINGAEKPYIPGSSLKGIFRSFMDVFIRSYGGYTCPGTGSWSCFNRVKGRIKDYLKAQDYDALLKLIWNYYCLSCKVYGSGSYRGKVYFYDFLPVNNVKLGVKPGIAIDRKTGTAFRHSLYQVEYVEPNTRFHGGIRIHDVPNYVLGIIALTLNEINEGRVKIGGFKTRGFGRVAIENLIVKIHLYTSYGGEVVNGSLILKPLDGIDVEIRYSGFDEVSEQTVVLQKDNAWGFLRMIVDNTLKNREYIGKIIKTHRPLR